MNGLYQHYGFLFVGSILPFVAVWLTLGSLKWPQEGDWILRLQMPLVLMVVMLGSMGLFGGLSHHTYAELPETGWREREALSLLHIIVANIIAVLAFVAQAFRIQKRNRSALS